MGSVRFIAAALFASTISAQDADYDAALARYRAGIQRPSLWSRAEARDKLAATGDPRAFEQLQRDYRRPEDPVEFVRALAVSLLAEHFARADSAPLWSAWRGADDAPRDVWMWYRGLCVEASAGLDSWREVVTGREPAELRAAAWTAGRVAMKRGLPGPAELDAMAGITDSRRDRGHAREVLVEAALALLDVGSDDALGADHLAFLREVVEFMRRSTTSERCRLVLSRTLARILRREDLGPDAGAWRAILDGETDEAAEIEYARRLAGIRQTFFGIPEHSRHVCYLIDASDSMLEALTPNERDALMPLTGPSAKGDPPRPDRTSARAERAIDWSRVRTRFDAARELLKLSIAELGDEQRFAIVLFGSRAEAMAATPRLVAPKTRTLDAVLAELDAIEAGPGDEERPLGTLRGDTNIHGAFRLAFQLTTSRPVEKDAVTDERGFRDGCDTIYLLSDGTPNWDDFEAVDENEDGEAADLETGRVFDYDGPLLYYGPFADERHLVVDLERMNLLRRATIHSVAIGEADDALLERIAAIGLGRVLRIGKR